MSDVSPAGLPLSKPRTLGNPFELVQQISRSLPPALRILRECWDELQPRITEIVELRERMADFQDQRFEPEYKKLWQQLIAEDERLAARTLKG